MHYPESEENPEYVGSNGTRPACNVPPPGWVCTREPGHAGPCAAVAKPNGPASALPPSRPIGESFAARAAARGYAPLDCVPERLWDEAVQATDPKPEADQEALPLHLRALSEPMGFDLRIPPLDEPGFGEPVIAYSGLEEGRDLDMLAPGELDIREACRELADFLVAKNRAYGNSALDPVRIMSRASSVEQILVRIDDKLSRMARGLRDDEDVEKDLLGYFLLLRCARRRAGR